MKFKKMKAIIEKPSKHIPHPEFFCGETQPTDSCQNPFGLPPEVCLHQSAIMDKIIRDSN